MNRIRQFAGQAAIYGLGSILSRIVYYLLVTFLLTKLLGDRTDEFGTYSAFYAYISVLIVIFSLRLDTALFRFGSKGKDLQAAFSTAFFPVIFIAVGIVLVGFFFNTFIAGLIGFPDHPNYIRYVALILAFDILNLLPFAKLRLTNRAKTFALYKIFNVALSGILILFFLVLMPRMEIQIFGLSAESYDLVSWVLIANVIASCLLFLSLAPVFKNVKFKLDKALLLKMLSYTYPLVIIGIANGVIQFFGTPLQQWFLSGDQTANLGQAGVYDTTRRIASLFVMFTTAFNYAAEPFFFNNSTESDRKELYGKICRLFTLVGGLVIIAMIIGIDILKYLVDPNYWSSLFLLPVLLIAYLLLGIYYNISIWYKLSDKTIYGAIISIIGMALTLIVSIIFLPTIGYAASAWATLISYFVMVLIAYYLGQKHFPIAYPVKKILLDVIVIVAIICCAFILRSRYEQLPLYAGYALLFVIYLVYAFRAERKEWRILVGL